jgi:hypothetical protein
VLQFATVFSKTRRFLPNALQIRNTMKPKKSPQDQPSTFQLFQARLDNIISPDHPLVHLAIAIQWERFDEAYAAFYCQNNGAPGLPTRLMVGLYYLKYTFNLSDEELMMRWLALKIFTGLTGNTFAVKHTFKPTSLAMTLLSVYGGDASAKNNSNWFSKRQSALP